MSLDRAIIENVETSVRQAAKIVASYRRQLESDGMPTAEAWALTQRLEERMLGPLFQNAERGLAPAPWADIEALFVAVVNLQLVLGQAPEPAAVVRYMKQSGVRVRALTTTEADRLWERTSIDPALVIAAFLLEAEA